MLMANLITNFGAKIVIELGCRYKKDYIARFTRFDNKVETFLVIFYPLCHFLFGYQWG